MNYSIIQFLDERLTKDLAIFEFGSGYSYLYFAQRARHVTSVEYDTTWLESIKKMAPENLSLLYRQHDIDGSYCRSINESGGSFDIVVVDGRDRKNCVREGIRALSETGVILLDDSEREEYRTAISLAAAQGFRSLTFDGLKTAEWRGARTTIFYRDGNCLGI
jgi:predicted O-methyltransferase YrrM